jgi:hypothetical protein
MIDVTKIVCVDRRRKQLAHDRVQRRASVLKALNIRGSAAVILQLAGIVGETVALQQTHLLQNDTQHHRNS